MLDKNGDKPFKHVHETLWARLVRSSLFLTVGCLKLRLSGCENSLYKVGCSRITGYSSYFLLSKISNICAFSGAFAPDPKTAAAKHIGGNFMARGRCLLVHKESKSCFYKETMSRIYRVVSNFDEILLKEIKKTTKIKLAERSVGLL